MLKIEGVTKRFGRVVAVSDISVTIESGEFFALLGPSGCGKTTLLRTIAGIYSADEGRIALEGTEIGDRPMSSRDIALVFQNYALFPHLSAFENVAFGLRMRRRPRAEIRTRVEEALELVRMGEFARRRPHELSGGQQQRVALARAIVVQPRLLLLDEPLSNLDAKLRDEMRDEIRALQHRLGLTTILVTHDLREAFAVSDRVGVMRDGRLEQVGSPWEIYDAPQSRFVAGFLGHVNILSGEVVGLSDETVTIRTGEGLDLTARRDGFDWRVGAGAWATLRPERLKIGANGAGNANGAGGNRFDAVVEDVTYLGSSVTLRLAVAGTVGGAGGGTALRSQLAWTGQALPQPGTGVAVGCDIADLVVRPDRPDAD